ncbi:ATP-binding cassette domain-containing protein, partial [Listeria monocytogenes]
MDLADLITFLLYITYMIEPIQKLTHMSMQFQEGITGFQRFMEMMNIEPSIKNKPNPIKLANLKGKIEFKEVSFCYGDHDDNVFVQLSFTIQQGDYIALVGPSGAGKTTLCSLIPRFYDVSGGAVLIDGINVRDIDIQSLRRNIGIVQQDVYLFSGTVLENIRYGNVHASDE